MNASRPSRTQWHSGTDSIWSNATGSSNPTSDYSLEMLSGHSRFLGPTFTSSLPNVYPPSASGDFEPCSQSRPASIQSALLSSPADRLSCSSDPGHSLASAPSNTHDTSMPSSSAGKKADNKFICSHCDTTFSKPTDQRKHLKKSCKSLGPGFKAFRCNACGDTSRTEKQAKVHQKAAHQRKRSISGYEKVDLIGRPRFSCCCPNGKIFTTMEEFHKHAVSRSSDGNLVSADQRIRLCTLLEEGKGKAPGGHEYLYAEVLSFCASHDIPDDQWKQLIAGSTFNAHELANRLEWGLTDSPLLLQSGLGFESCRTIVEIIFDQLVPAVCQTQDDADCQHTTNPSHLNHSNEQAVMSSTFTPSIITDGIPYLTDSAPHESASNEWNGPHLAVRDNFQLAHDFTLTTSLARPPVPQEIWDHSSFGHAGKFHVPADASTTSEITEDRLHQVSISPVTPQTMTLRTSIMNEPPSTIKATLEHNSAVANRIQPARVHENQKTFVATSKKRPLSIYSATHPDSAARGSRTMRFQSDDANDTPDEFETDEAMIQHMTADFYRPKVQSSNHTRDPIIVGQQPPGDQRLSPSTRRHGVLLEYPWF